MLFACVPVMAQLNVAATATNYTIDFDATVTDVNNGTYDGGGFVVAPAATDLDADAYIRAVA